MTPVDQRILACPDRNDGHNANGIAGDCARAAYASILNLDLHQVPHFAHYPAAYVEWELRGGDPLTCEHGGLYWRRVRRFLRSRGMDAASYDWDPHDVRIYDADGYPWDGHVLASGPSPRGPFDHLVVARYRWIPTGRPGRLRPTVEIVHDPHPSRAGLVEIASIELILAPYDPAPPSEEQEHVSAIEVTADV